MPDPSNPRNNSLIVPGAATEASMSKMFRTAIFAWHHGTVPRPSNCLAGSISTRPDQRSKGSYPVFYLLHGWGEIRKIWTKAGLSEIMDNLLAEKKIKPNNRPSMPNDHPDGGSTSSSACDRPTGASRYESYRAAYLTEREKPLNNIVPFCRSRTASIPIATGAACRLLDGSEQACVYRPEPS